MRFAVLAVLCAAALIGCGSDEPASVPAAEESTLEIGASVISTNVLSMLDEAQDKPRSQWAGCEEMPGDYEALREGKQIELINGSGEVISVAELKTSRLDAADDHVCMWDATFTDVPTGHAFYGTRIADWKSDLYPENELPDGSIVINLS